MRPECWLRSLLLCSLHLYFEASSAQRVSCGYWRGVWVHGSSKGWKQAGKGHTECNPVLRAAAGSRHWHNTSQELHLCVFLSPYRDKLHIIPFISFRLQPLCSADMNKKNWAVSVWWQFYSCSMSDNSCIPLLCSVSFSYISQAECFIRYPHTQSSASPSKRQLFKWISSLQMWRECHKRATRLWHSHFDLRNTPRGLLRS